MSLFESRRRSGNSWRSPKSQILHVSARAGSARKDRMYKVGAIFLLGLALAGSLWAAFIGVHTIGRWIFSENDRFTVRRMDIKSTGKLTPRHICEYARIGEGMNLFAVNLEEARRSLESVAVIKSASLTRILPDTLKVRVTERIPVARLGADDRISHFAVDADGSVLGPTFRSPTQPAITGLREVGISPGAQLTNAVLADALSAIEIIESGGYAPVLRVASIDVGQDDHLEMKLANGVRVLLGRNNLPKRIQDLVLVIREMENRGQSAAILDFTVDRNIPGRPTER